MVDKEKFPTIPAKQWWLLRSKFRQSILPTVTSGYLAGALGMSEESAKHNILPALYSFKIIDQDGKPTERAKQWRDDEQYPNVCQQIREEIYPSELIHALPPPTPNRGSVERWIANRTGVGESASGKMVSVYLLLCEAKPLTGQDVSVTVPNKHIKTIAKSKKTQMYKTIQATTTDAPFSNENIPANVSKPKVSIAQSLPSIHIDIQIHISSDSSNNQIDQIFSSMSNHLGKLINHTDE